MAGKVRMPRYTNLCQKWMDLLINFFSPLKKNAFSPPGLSALSFVIISQFSYLNKVLDWEFSSLECKRKDKYCCISFIY